MLGTFYLRRLERDLDRWTAARLISTDQAQAMLHEVRAEHARGGRATGLMALGLIGALLVGLGIISLVASNWDALSKLVKLALVGLMLWGTYGGAYLVRRHLSQTWLAHTMLLLGVLVFGAAIALVAQIFHLPANAPGGILLWCIGAFAVAALAPSQPAAIAGVALAALWTLLVVDDSWRSGPVHWWFLPVWLAWAGLAAMRNWRITGHAAMLALLLWSAFAVWLGDDSIGIEGAARLVTSCWALALAIGYAGIRRDIMTEWAGLLHRYALVSVLAGTFLIANLHHGWGGRGVSPPIWIAAGILPLVVGGCLAWWAERGVARSLPWLCAAVLAVLFAASGFAVPERPEAVAVILHVAYIAGVIGLIAWGHAAEDRFTINLGFVFLGIGLLDVYFDSAWLLFDRGLFFIGGGLLLLALAWLFERQRRRLLDGLEARP